MDNFLKYLFPEKCMLCGSMGSLLCGRCWNSCVQLNSHYCLIFEDLKLDVYSPLSYVGTTRECLRKAKFFNKHFRILKVLTDLCLERYLYSFKDFIVVPIPSSPEKLKKRGFNQAEVISRVVAHHYNLRHQNSILTRKITSAQFTLTKNDRFANLKDAFEVPPSRKFYLKNKKILLVDDLCTSGATFVSAASVLYKNGAEEVICFSLMRQLRKLKVKFKDVGIVQHEYF